MTKFVKLFAVVALVASLAACATGNAQDESVVNGDRTFNNAQNK